MPNSKSRAKSREAKSDIKSKDKVKSNDEDKLNKILDEIRPALMRDGGNLELVSYDKKAGVVEIVLQGACAHCPIADVTLKHLIEAEIKGQMPHVKEVRAV